jgi:hypothetical protein
VLASFHGDVWARAIRPTASTAFSYQPVVLDVESDPVFLLLRTGSDRPSLEGGFGRRSAKFAVGQLYLYYSSQKACGTELYRAVGALHSSQISHTFGHR